MKVALYARGNDAAGIERQRTALSTWANANGHIAAGEYVDVSLQPGRPEFTRLVANAKSNPRPFTPLRSPDGASSREAWERSLRFKTWGSTCFPWLLRRRGRHRCQRAR